MVKANVIPGKFLSCLLGIFIGILLTLGGLVGGGFYVYKNVKVGSLLGLLPQETDNWLSDEYAQNTIEGLVKELQSLANGDITLEKVAQISPAAGDKIDEVLDNVNQNGIVTLDRDALYKTPINQLTSNLMDVVIITSTLDSLSETMNFALPDMPLITGGGQDKEVWVYTAVNDNETHTIDKAIALGDYTYYTRSSKYERVTEEKITSLYSLSGVVTDENGYLKKDGKFIYARDVVQGDSGETYRYTKLERDSKLIDAADGETYTFLTDQLFFKNGPDGEYTKLTLTDGGSRTVYAVPSAYAYRLLYAEQGDGYVLATRTDEGGNPVSGSGGFEILTQFENVHLFAETDVYDEVTEPTEEIVRNNLLFVKTDGIGSLPVNYGITALSGALDVKYAHPQQSGRILRHFAYERHFKRNHRRPPRLYVRIHAGRHAEHSTCLRTQTRRFEQFHFTVPRLRRKRDRLYGGRGQSDRTRQRTQNHYRSHELHRHHQDRQHRRDR